MQITQLNELIYIYQEVAGMVKTCKHTSRKVAKKASGILRDGRYSKAAKSVAGSALSQRQKHKR